MTSVSTPRYALFFVLSIFSLRSSYCLQTSTISCPEIEKQSLLSLKLSLNDPRNLLSSWNSVVDCCKWDGIVCNNTTGHVHELHLQNSGLSGKINSSILNLKHLKYLDLSLNKFVEESIPSFIGSFTELEYLDFSNAQFEGTIPHNIGNLSNLRTLNLESEAPLLDVDSLEWLSGLSKLEYLNMNRANLRRAANWAKVINSLSSLLEIHFSSCGLDFTSPLNIVNLTFLTHVDFSVNFINNDCSIPVPPWFFQLENLLYLDIGGLGFTGPVPTVSNATKLQYIRLAGNHFNSSIPDWLYLCKDVVFADLSDTSFQGKISDAIGNLTSLESLDLSRNMLSGKLPKDITNLCKLRTLDLSSNELSGDMHDSFGNMSSCFLESLEEVRLLNNRLSGHLTEQFGEFRSLQRLDLSNNSLSGALPTSLGNISSLEYLRLGDNNFTENLPESLGHLSKLEEFYVENNKLEGVVTESHFTNLSNLRIFFASANHLTLNVGPNWVPPIQLNVFLLQSWSLGLDFESEIPSWLQTPLRNISYLDISNTGITGSIPDWFWDIVFLNVSRNNLHGNIPPVIGRGYYQSFYLSSNKLSGLLPQLGAYVSVFDVSFNLFSEGISDFLCDSRGGLNYLNLEGNLLSGELPDCFRNWPSLSILKLGNNSLSGNIPNSIGFLPELRSLSLYRNNFSGPIPSEIRNCTKLSTINLSRNNLDGELPAWMGTTLLKLKFLILRSNKLSGQISSKICHLQSLQLLDLSDNKLSGIIPSCVSNFTAMSMKRLLELEGYYITMFYSGPFESESVVTKGVELEYSTTLSLVTVIDLSRNNLSGEIPNELTTLLELRSLNLSGNYLTGPIPERIGDMKHLESLDFSRNNLSGQIPNSLAVVSSMSHLNLSFNKLTGRVPVGPQLQTFEASSFIGNDLCGAPLNKCSSHGGDEVPSQKGEKSEIKWLYVLLSLGYAVGFSSACTALVLNKSWRDAYFGLLESAWDKISPGLYIKWASLTRLASSILRR